MELKIGIDIGGVLRRKRSSLVSHDDMLQPPTPDAIEVMKHIVTRYGKENLYIVSKVSEESEESMLTWLQDNGIFDYVGMDPLHVHFCRLRTDKVQIANKLQLVYFVDDRADVLEPMRGTVNRRIMYSFNGKHEDTYDTEIIKLSSWREIEEDLFRHFS